MTLTLFQMTLPALESVAGIQRSSRGIEKALDGDGARGLGYSVDGLGWEEDGVCCGAVEGFEGSDALPSA